MKRVVHERYDTFDTQRRRDEALAADADDLRTLEAVEKSIGKSVPKKDSRGFRRRSVPVRDASRTASSSPRFALSSAAGERGIRMGRGRHRFFDDLSKLPWPAALVVGVIGYAAIRYGVPAFFSRQDGPFAQGLATASVSLAPLAWMFLALCCVCALIAYANARRRCRLLDTRTGLDSLAAPGWHNFERLVGEAFRRQGYAIEETGLGGADGGIDLVLRKGGQRTLVQCKQWRRRQVPVNVVREMYGLLAHHGAHAVRIATVGGFTKDAARFAAGKPIELIDGPTLLAMIREVQAIQARPPPITAQPPAQRVEPACAPSTPGAAATPACPRCNAAMVERSNSRSGSTFWGCPAYPACRGTR